MMESSSHWSRWWKDLASIQCWRFLSWVWHWVHMSCFCTFLWSHWMNLSVDQTSVCTDSIWFRFAVEQIIWHSKKWSDKALERHGAPSRAVIWLNQERDLLINLHSGCIIGFTQTKVSILMQASNSWLCQECPGVKLKLPIGGRTYSIIPSINEADGPPFHVCLCLSKLVCVCCIFGHVINDLLNLLITCVSQQLMSDVQKTLSHLVFIWFKVMAKSALSSAASSWHVMPRLAVDSNHADIALSMLTFIFLFNMIWVVCHWFDVSVS